MNIIKTLEEILKSIDYINVWNKICWMSKVCLDLWLRASRNLYRKCVQIIWYRQSTWLNTRLIVVSLDTSKDVLKKYEQLDNLDPKKMLKKLNNFYI